ncbi:MAG: formate--tetrahydrofolate ligase [Prevotella sp.]|uniref:formate--tetrahydrofolate ligase n=1 Tax=Prevotella sp. TaxID=59823 RepID=UPI002A999ED6|nr:formate--tetrahydrofolate ligase [Prevotella sp.]MDD7189348.1 formate--tetrahydrofolate ligase [Prevotella sp.]MDY5313952.1 formate--tetrahydrofolate ligase [Prevotella sp.]
MKTDIEIAQETTLRRIDDIAKELGIDENHIEPYGRYIAKVSLDAIDEERMKRHNLILVTAISPTKAGIGKTTVSVGLALGLNKIGKKAVVALREPSLGPCFGMKGGACGGGYAQLLPMDKINLHFTGDFHAITTANNMIAALLDNYLYQHAKDGFRLKTILWKRVLDVNDRSLRQIITGLGPLTNGIPTQTGFDITPASEIMGIMCFAKDIDDLKRRIGNILLGFDYQDKPFYVRDMGVEGSIAVLLKDALKPNLVQTTEGTPAIVHCGPFANIAHGCNSVVATKMALTLGDYAITEAGFGADLGAEKFYDIKCRTAGLQPALTVLVVTLQALKMHGGVAYQDIKEPNIEAVKQGFWNLDKHVENIKRFGQKIVVAFNRYNNDTEEEIEAVRAHCQELGVGFAVNNAFAEGGKGAEELANTVVKTIEDTPSPKLQYLYKDDDSVKDKIEAVAKKIYGAGSVSFARKAETQLKHIYDLGLSGLPVCVAKTQYSFSVDPKAYGKTDGFHLDVADIVINSGSGMIVAIAGNILRMPGLPATPQANNIDIVDGKIVGLS